MSKNERKYGILDLRKEDLQIEGLEVIEDKEYCLHYGKTGLYRTIPKEGYRIIVVTKDFAGSLYAREVGGISWGDDIVGLRTNDRVVLIPPDPNDGHTVMPHEDIDSVKVVGGEKSE